MKKLPLHEKMTPELFKNPPAVYRGTPFWAWNGELNEEELVRQIDMFQKMGLGGFHMHSRTGLSKTYLSEEYMDLVRLCCDEAEKRNMLAWLYDEDRWPSGAAGGYVTKNKEYRSRAMVFTIRPTGAPGADTHDAMEEVGNRSEDETLLWCYDIVLAPNGLLRSFKRVSENDPVEGTRWYAYLSLDRENPWYNNQTYVDTLNPKAIQKFIDITYEAYKKAVGDRFDTIVPSIFTDEPQFSRKTQLKFAEDTTDVSLPWTNDFPETYEKAWNEKIEDVLPLLIWDAEDGAELAVRYHYHDHVAARFAEAFADQCGAWCRENGLLLTGHMMEEPTLKSQTAALGDAMRSYRGFGLPGIDMLCDHREFTTAKQAQSGAHQYGCPGVLSELYGVTGWTFDFRGHKLQGDWQAALGVTVRVPHLSWYTMKGESKRDYPAAISYQSPWWDKYSRIETHFARVATAMNLGKPHVRIAVVHPVESYWLHWGPEEQTNLIRNEMDERFQNLTDWLITGALDFDFLCESNLADQCPVAGAPLQVGAMAYDTVVIPQCETIRRTTLERLLAFAKAGGRIVLLGAVPTLVDAVPSEEPKALLEYANVVPFSKSSVYAALQPVRELELRGGNGAMTDHLMTQMRDDGDTRWLFIAQGHVPARSKDMPEAAPLKITVQGEWNAVLYDTMTGDITPIPAEVAEGATVIRRTLCQQDSLLLHLLPGKAAVAAGAETETEWTQLPLPKTVPVRLEEPNVLLLDMAKFALNDEPLQEEEEILRADNVLREKLGWPYRKKSVAQPWTYEKEVPPHTIHLQFEVETRITLTGAKFATEDAEKATLLLDGVKVEAGPDGYFTDRSIGTIPLPEIAPGVHTFDLILPFGHTTDPEWCYLLGDFDVMLRGRKAVLVEAEREIGFGDIVMQGKPFYGANVTYHMEVDVPQDGDLKIHASSYRGSLIGVCLDGKRVDSIILPPYNAIVKNVPTGHHTVSLMLFGNRHNSFAPLHLVNEAERWIGPKAWRTEGDNWCYEYKLKPFGILKQPQITLCK